jgi:hypothetical protein
MNTISATTDSTITTTTTTTTTITSSTKLEAKSISRHFLISLRASKLQYVISYNLPNDAVITSDCIALNGRMTHE